jgi:lipoprotein-anchoring transpeptidase ErfK/SrfK
MKHWRFLVTTASVLLVGYLGAWLTITGGSPEQRGEAVWGDSLSVSLPEPENAAKKELASAKNELNKLKPSRPYIVIDTHANILTLRTEDRILLKATCSTGSGGELIDPGTGRRWVFDTPRGVFKVKSKLADPWWRKPDWAFIEENESIPQDPKERLDPEMLGDFALGFGDDYYIHGTIYERLLGVNVTHGCVRLGSEDLKKLYDQVSIGTPVYIF